MSCKNCQENARKKERASKYAITVMRTTVSVTAIIMGAVTIAASVVLWSLGYAKGVEDFATPLASVVLYTGLIAILLGYSYSEKKR